MADRVVTYTLRGNITDLTAKMTAAGASVGKVATEMTALDARGAKMRSAFTSVGTSAGKMGLVAAGGLAVMAVATMRFDKQMSAVQAATHASADAMATLRTAAIEAGADTAFSASEAAQGIEELAKAGVSTTDILDGGLKGALDLAAAGALGVGESAEIAATALTQFGLDGADVPHVADLLAASAGKAQGSVSDMGMALKQSGLVAAQTGLTIEETTGTLAAFASAGLIGSDSGTSFKTMLQALTPTGKKAADEMDRLGITAYDAQGNFVGMTTFADSLKNGLKDLSVEQQNAAMKTIFGSDAVRAAAVVFQEGGAGIQGWIDSVNDAGYASETAALRMDNLAGDFEKLKGSLETALISSGDGSMAPLREATQLVTGLVNAYNDLPGPIKNGAVALVGLTAALGATVFVASRAASGYASLKGNMNDLSVSFENANKKALAFRAGAAAAGAGLMAVSSPAHRASDSLGLLVDAGSAAAIGFAVGGPWGAAIGGGAALLGSLGSSSSDAAMNLEGLTATLDQQTGAITSNTAQWVSKALADSDAAAAIVAAGVSLSTVTDAVLGNKSAMDEVTTATENFGSAGAMILDPITAMRDELLSGTDATKSASKAAEDSVEAQSAAAGGLAATSEAAAALDKQNRSTAESFIDLSDDADEAKESLSSWIKDLADQADALNNFTKNAETASKRGLEEGLIQSLRDMGPEGAARLRDLANASDSELERANRAWRKGQRAIENYIEKFGEVPPGVATKVTTPGMAAAMYSTVLLTAQISALGRMRANPSVSVTGIGGALQGLANLGEKIRNLPSITKAEGGAILRASGGSVLGPGTGTSDSIPATGPGGAKYRLSNGEHVLTADEVDRLGGQAGVYRFRASVRAGDVKAFATGGAIGDMTQSSRLDIAQQRRQIRDLERSLRERETVGKGGNKRRRNVLRGLDRSIARMELREAREELAAMRNENAKLKRYGGEEGAKAFSSAKDQFSSNFTIGSLGSASAVDRSLTQMLANSATFMGLLGDLKAKGASPWLLSQLVAAGPTGAAIRLARQYNTDSAAFNAIQVQAKQMDQYANSYAGLISNPNFLKAGKWNSGVSSASQAPLVASLVGAEIAVGANGLMQFVNGQIVVAQDKQATEARFAS